MAKLKLFINKEKTVLIITVICIITALLQGNPAFFYSSHQFKITLFVVILLVYLTILYFLLIHKKLTETNLIIMIITAGVLLRSFYVLLTGVNDRQHDEGVYTSLSDTFINPGHLGYIEYLCKFKHLPDFSPYQLFSYYHPPVHHILASIFIQFNLFFGVPEVLAFENIQILTLLYSSLCIPVTYGILKKLPLIHTNICFGVALIAFHPGMIYMSGSVNNDMLATLLTFVCFYFSLCWIYDKSFINLIKIALSLGFGMITKLNTAVMAFPLALIFIIYFIQECKNKKGLSCFRNYCIFGIITAGIGLSWVIRNLLFYRTNPGVPVLTEKSVLYIGRHSVSEIFGIPHDFIMRYPFHTINGNQICNSWLILFRTSIFAEIRPDNLSDVLMAACQLALLLTMIFGILFALTTIYVQIYEIRKGDKELGIFLLTGYLAVIITFVGFVIKYPYTCSCDFRYIVISILFTAITIHQINNKRTFGRFNTLIVSFLNWGIIAILTLTTSILLFWNQW